MSTSIKGSMSVKGKYTAGEPGAPVVFTDDHADFASVAATSFTLQDIAMGKTISGKLTPKTSQFGDIVIDRDVDVFTFSADKNDMYNGVIRVDTPDQIIKMKVFDKDKNFLGDFQTSVSITFAFETPVAQKYYIAIYGDDPDAVIEYKTKIVKVIDR